MGRRWLLPLILLLGITFILVGESRRPGAWRWLDLLSGKPQDAPPDGVNNRLASLRPNGPHPDSFVIPKPGPGTENPEPRKGYFPGVNPALLDAIRDDTFSSAADRDCSLSLLDVLDKADSESIRKASEGRVAYAQLFRQPAHYRGRLVTVSGVVRRVNRLELGENKYGFRQYYQVWLYPNVTPPSPIVVYCLRLPEGFPTGMKLSEDAEVTGFFLKRWAYLAEKQFRTAPTILAKTLQWHKRPVAVEKPTKDDRAIILGAVGAALLAMLTAWYVYRRTKPSHPDLPDRPPNFDLLKEMDQGSDAADER